MIDVVSVFELLTDLISDPRESEIERDNVTVGGETVREKRYDAVESVSV